ncbi:MAG: hypothetical protein HOP96_00735 [Sphingomonas sp.]|nr:hypothetical protein [Sphingomonas sp.]
MRLLALSASLAMSLAAQAAAQAPSLAHESPGQFIARCAREVSPATAAPPAAQMRCRMAFSRMMGTRRIAQLLLDAAPPGRVRDDAATLKQRIGPIKWAAAPDDKGIMLGELGEGWMAFIHGPRPVTFVVVMWRGEGAHSFALPAALRWLGAKVDPLLCQTKANGLDRVYWVTPPGKPGVFLEVAETEPDNEGMGEYAASMDLKDPDRPPTQPLTAQERAEGYTYDCPSEF